MDILNWMHRVDEINVAGRSFERTATSEQCWALANALGLLTCDGLTAKYTLKQKPGNSFQLNGTLQAKGTQACVVSLEPVDFDIDEVVAVTFTPKEDIVDVEPDEELDALALDDVEPYSGNVLDAGRVFYYHFSANLDPYPRKPGVAFDAPAPKPGEGETTHPFAVLEKLKKSQ